MKTNLSNIKGVLAWLGLAASLLVAFAVSSAIASDGLLQGAARIIGGSL